MIIDYKLVLILVLSIALLFIYNKTEDLREEVEYLKRKNHKNDVTNSKIKTSEQLINIFQEKNRVITDDFEINKNKEITKEPNNIIKNKAPNTCPFPVLSQNQSLNKSYIVEKDNTSCYNATESSEEIEINYEDESTSQNEEYVIFSNDKQKSEIINMQKTLDNIENGNEIIVEGPDLLLTTTILSKTFDGKIDIINDSSNSEEKNNIKIHEIETYTDISEEKIMKEFDNIEIKNENGVLLLHKVNEEEEDQEEEEEEEDQEENNNSESIDDINTSEFQKISLTSINKYKLDDLQKIAKKFNIEITKDKNGKEINKTKKELYNELSCHKEN